MMQKRPAIRSKKLRDSARGQECTLRFQPGCDPDTVVLCHLPGRGRGVGYKGNDTHAVYGCARCHDQLDGRAPRYMHADAFWLSVVRALDETHDRMVRAGLITVE